MNVYDFDGTVYAGDSTLDFYFYELGRHPELFKFVPKQASGFFRCKVLKKIDKTGFKSDFFSFLRGISDLEMELEQFWDQKQGRIKQWYLKQKADSDVIISASPEFLLEVVCRRIFVGNLIASEVDKRTGVFLSRNCYGEEKARRWRERFGNADIDCFYSDSESDLPLALMAEKAFFVKGNRIVPWKIL